MKILFTASECVPFVKTGGLADVVGALAPVLAAQGHDVRVILPLYSAIPQKWTEQLTHVCDFEVQLGWRRTALRGTSWITSTTSAAPIFTVLAATNTSDSASSAVVR